MLCDAHLFIAKLIRRRLVVIDSELDRLKLEKMVLSTDIHLKHAEEQFPGFASQQDEER